MSITIIVEDGTGLTNATSYLSVAEFRAYWTQKGITYTQLDSEIAVWINEGTRYADYIIRWGGVLYTETQSLQIPRSSWYDKAGRLLTGVPQFVKNGVAELAAVMKGVIPVIDDGIQSESYGPVRISYKNSRNNLKINYPGAFMWFSFGASFQSGTLTGIPT